VRSMLRSYIGLFWVKEETRSRNDCRGERPFA
jgi:hypothetical protein